MPPVATQSNLLMSELGAEFVKAHETHKNVQVTPGGELPAGVRGVAQLKGCRIQKIAKGKKDEGKLMFYAYGIVVTPENHNGMRVRGKRTMITEPIFATPTRTRKTVADHIKKVYEHLALLGLNLKDVTPQNIEQRMTALVNPKNPVFFEFHTWQGQVQTTGQYAGKEPMINHQWDGRTDYKKEDAVKVDVDVNLPEPTEPLPDDESYNETNNGTDTSTLTPSSPEINMEEFDKGWDLDSMAKRADPPEQDLECVNRLTQQALGMGFTQDQVDKTDSWTDLVKMMKANPSANGSHKEESKTEENEIAIGVGDHMNYRPIDPVSKKRSDKPVIVEVAVMNEKDDKLIVDLREVARRKIWYKNIDASELEPLT